MKYITIIILSATLLACSTTRKDTAKKEVAKSNSIEYKFDLSLQTKMFLQKFNNEKTGDDIEAFIPSKELVDKYNIIILDDIYTISGFIKINNDYDQDYLTQINIKPGSKVDNIITVIIPLSSIDNFLTLNGIDYFEISEKVKLKSK